MVCIRHVLPTMDERPCLARTAGQRMRTYSISRQVQQQLQLAEPYHQHRCWCSSAAALTLRFWRLWRIRCIHSPKRMSYLSDTHAVSDQ